jgi:hypothetical protein
VSKFVEECRREWRRLRVPDSLAKEMAADLTADLEEAKAEGASVEDVLGSSAFDPRSFARSWAASAGVIQASTTPPDGSSRRWLPLAALVASAIAVIGALVLILPIASGHGLTVRPAPPGNPALLAPPTGTSPVYLHALGVLVLIVGIVGMVATLVWIRWTRGGGARWSSAPPVGWPRP